MPNLTIYTALKQADEQAKSGILQTAKMALAKQKRLGDVFGNDSPCQYLETKDEDPKQTISEQKFTRAIIRTQNDIYFYVEKNDQETIVRRLTLRQTPPASIHFLTETPTPKTIISSLPNAFSFNNFKDALSYGYIWVTQTSWLGNKSYELYFTAKSNSGFTTSEKIRLTENEIKEFSTKGAPTDFDLSTLNRLRDRTRLETLKNIIAPDSKILTEKQLVAISDLTGDSLGLSTHPYFRTVLNSDLIIGDLASKTSDFNRKARHYIDETMLSIKFLSNPEIYRKNADLYKAALDIINYLLANPDKTNAFVNKLKSAYTAQLSFLGRQAAKVILSFISDDPSAALQKEKEKISMALVNARLEEKQANVVQEVKPAPAPAPIALQQAPLSPEQKVVDDSDDILFRKLKLVEKDIPTEKLNESIKTIENMLQERRVKLYQIQDSLEKFKTLLMTFSSKAVVDALSLNLDHLFEIASAIVNSKNNQVTFRMPNANKDETIKFSNAQRQEVVKFCFMIMNFEMAQSLKVRPEVQLNKLQEATIRLDVVKHNILINEKANKNANQFFAGIFKLIHELENYQSSSYFIAKQKNELVNQLKTGLEEIVLKWNGKLDGKAALLYCEEASNLIKATADKNTALENTFKTSYFSMFKWHPNRLGKILDAYALNNEVVKPVPTRRRLVGD